MAKQRVTLRQRLRADAEKLLLVIRDEAIEQLNKVAGEHGIDAKDLAKFLSEGQHKTLRNDLVTLLANNKERELEKLYNDQLDMLQEDKHA